MRKFLSLATLLLFFTLFPNPAGAQEKINLTGIWEGTIYIADIDIDMELTLVLTERNGTISGRITDDWGYINCDITEPNRENNVLTFKALVETPSDDHQMSFKMIINSFEASLKRLDLDYVDIYYLLGVAKREAVLHAPFLEVMESLKKSGKARFIGVTVHQNEPEVLYAVVDSKIYDVVLTSYNFRKICVDEIK